MKKAISIPSELKKVGSIFSDAGYKAYLVGGAVRDALLGKPVHDWDLATNATPQQVMKLFRKVIPTGIAHGTVTVRIFNRSIEVTTFRTESTYSDGRHPDAVAYAATIEEDLSRRDFTMNAIAADLTDGTLADPFDGQADIQHKIIRTVGNPYDRFAEDGLRPVRAVRFAGQLGFTIEEQTLKALSDAEVLKKTDSISRERFRDEWCKMLLTPKPSLCIKLLEQTGILNLFIPQFTACRGSEQKDSRGYHVFDVADHLIYATDGAPQDNLIVRLAAFYHDIAKPQCRSIEQQGEDSDPAVVHHDEDEPQHHAGRQIDALAAEQLDVMPADLLAGAVDETHADGQKKRQRNDLHEVEPREETPDRGTQNLRVRFLVFRLLVLGSGKPAPFLLLFRHDAPSCGTAVLWRPIRRGRSDCGRDRRTRCRSSSR